MSWAGVVKKGSRKTPSYAAALAAPVAKTDSSRRHCWTQPAPTAPVARINTGRSIWSSIALGTTPSTTHRDVACTGNPDLSLDCSGFPALNTSGDLGSPHASLSSSHSTAISISPKPTRKGGRHGRTSNKHQKNANKSKLAEDIQSAMLRNSFKFNQSPEKVWAKRRREEAIANAVVLTHMHIGAGLIGKCAGFGPYQAQTEALEWLLLQQNPANWDATIAKHQQVAEAEQVQLCMAQHCPAMLPRLKHLEQLAAIQVLPEAKQHHTAAIADIKACLATTLKQQQAAEDSAQAASEAHAAELAQAASDAHTAELLHAAAEAHATEASDPATAIPAQTATAANNTNETIAAAVQTAVEAVVEGQISQPEAARAPVDAVSSSLAGVEDAQTLQVLESELSGPVWSSLTASSACDSETDRWGTLEQSSHDSTADISADSPSEGVAPQPRPLLTEADAQRFLDYVQRMSNCAYGIQAEHDHIQELATRQAQHTQKSNYSWHKMGAPDNRDLGVEYFGITFEFGCQVDRGLQRKGSNKAIPVELKNRTQHLAWRVLEHEHVQVQAQLQLCNAPLGMLIERMELADGTVKHVEHEIHKDDWFWERKVLPALYRFLAVFARLATQQEELDTYVSKRASRQHHQHLRDLINQQVVTTRLPALF